MKRTRTRNSEGPFVKLPKSIMTTPAWRIMSPSARLLWIELRGWLRNDRHPVMMVSTYGGGGTGGPYVMMVST
jgi:hypothetical protein